MRFELFEGETLYGVFTTRRTAMADAELFAAKRGQRLHWGRPSKGVITGSPDPVESGTSFTVQAVADDPWSRGRPHHTRR